MNVETVCLVLLLDGGGGGDSVGGLQNSLTVPWLPPSPSLVTYIRPPP